VTWPGSGPITTWPGNEFTSTSVSAWLFEPTGRARVDVVGEASYQGTLELIGGGRTIDGVRNRDHMAALLPEPTNPYDPNAVRVYLLPVASGQPAGRIGYLSREDAVAYRPIIDRLAALGQVMACRAWLSGGWDRGLGDRGHIGVVLYLGTVAECENDLAADPPRPVWDQTQSTGDVG
jgi:hypothetical protein